MQCHYYPRPFSAPPPNPSGYPLDALGPVLGPAINEHCLNTGVAIEMIAISAMAAMHVCVQDLVDVQRPDCQPSPCSEFYLLIAGSGEGKDTAAAPFIRPIREYEQELDETSQDAHSRYLAEQAAWKAEERWITKRMEQAAAEGEDMEDIKSEYGTLVTRRPKRSAEPKIIHDNITSGALEDVIGAGSQSIMVVTTEAGGLLNGQLGRSNDFWNLGWDSTASTKGRVASGRKVIADYRISSLLGSQPTPFQKYLDKRGKDAHGSGFTARLMIAAPHSTLGSRFLLPNQVKSFFAIEQFGRRVKELLRASTERRAAGRPREAIRFSPEAARLFMEIYNHNQEHLAAGQILNSISGQGAKSAEHIARIACALHGFEGHEGPLDVRVLERARQIGFWHLNQFFLMFAPGQPGDQCEADAQAVAQAIRSAFAHGIGYVSRKELKNWCRAELSTGRFNNAVHLLLDRALISVRQHGRTMFITGAPALIWR